MSNKTTVQKAARRLQREYGVSYAEALRAAEDGTVPGTSLRLRLDANGQPFDAWLRHVLQHEGAYREMRVFLLQWNRLTGELAATKTPDQVTVDDYARRWSTPLESAKAMLGAFHRVLPTERTPARLLTLLQRGLPSSDGEQPFEFAPLLGAKVLDPAAEELLLLEMCVKGNFGLGKTADYEWNRAQPGGSPTLDAIVELERRELVSIESRAPESGQRMETYATITRRGRRRIATLVKNGVVASRHPFPDDELL